jgi:hypothetical protein
VDVVELLLEGEDRGAVAGEEVEVEGEEAAGDVDVEECEPNIDNRQDMLKEILVSQTGMRRKVIRWSFKSTGYGDSIRFNYPRLILIGRLLDQSMACTIGKHAWRNGLGSRLGEVQMKRRSSVHTTSKSQFS